MAKLRVFDNEGEGLDRFGLLLTLTVASVILNLIVDLDDPSATTVQAIGWFASTVITGLTLVVAMRSSGAARRIRVFVGTVVVVSVAIVTIVIAAFLIAGEDLDTGSGTPSAVWVLITVTAPLVVLRRVFQHKQVTRQTIFGAVAVFLLIALTFDYAFLTVNAFSATGPVFETPEPTTAYMYFSLVTITTLGYGDLSPVSEFARLLAASEAVIGQIFLVTIVARLVSLYGQDQRPAASASMPEIDPRREP